MEASASDIERFMKFVSPEALTGCWLWTGAADHHGYGRFGLSSTVVKTHRFSAAVFKRHDITGLDVCHHCDTPSCVNPLHLFVGTAKDNTLDMFRKGRNPPRTKEFCKRGHKLSETGRIYEALGQRQCRLCNNIRAREKNAANRKERILATHCGYGHQFSDENTYVFAGRGRSCKECQKRISAKSNLKRKAQRQLEAKQRKAMK